jgi:hypothetical protein
VGRTLFGNLALGMYACPASGSTQALTEELYTSPRFYGFHGSSEGRAYVGGRAGAIASGLPLREGSEAVLRLERGTNGAITLAMRVGGSKTVRVIEGALAEGEGVRPALVLYYVDERLELMDVAEQDVF